MGQAAGLERLYVDFDSFFATAEQHLRPELRERPVGVISIDSPHTGLIAASREAKRLGIKRSFWVREARRVCPSIVLVPARHDAYVRLHGDIVKAVNSVIPLLAVRSIDEMVCALSPGDQTHPEAVGRAVKASIARHVGAVLTCSVGIAPTELLAKIAAEMEKPDGLVVIRPEDLPGPLLRLTLTDVPGIARGNAARLRRAGVTDMAGFWSLAPKQARAIWGSIEGERMWAELHGYAVERPATGRVMFGHGRVLPQAWRRLDRAYACARYLAVKAARRMRCAGLAARALAAWLTDKRGAGWFGEERFAPAWDDRSILMSLGRLFGQAGREGSIGCRSVHVMLHDLVPLDAGQRDLFDVASVFETRRRWERLSVLRDLLHARYGRDVLSLGPSSEPPGGYAGAKIAFNRIPEERDF